ncbi:hypothetical protein SLS62_010117 [Diatrype stigma]|uniref:Tail specific protease domain-containing protein n=1 Tax=Diatrype stigma TaxID=117547 RepID=A0AAN9UJU3_9PEZI
MRILDILYWLAVPGLGLGKIDSEETSDYHGVSYVTHGRNVSYDIPDPKLPEISQWLISNPNRINLGRIGLKYKGASLTASQIKEPRQELDLWTGAIKSTFKVDDQEVAVTTRGDLETDAVTFEIDSELISSGSLQVELDFPYPPIHTTKYKYEVFVGSYDFPLNHSTSIDNGSVSGAAHIHHELQQTSYFINLRWPLTSPLNLSRDEPEGSINVTAHRYTLASDSKAGPSSSLITFTARFSLEKEQADLPLVVETRNIIGWRKYWTEGGFVDLTSSSNPNATELQRRIVLSQYHVRVNSAAKGQSPQESGLMNNGWYGKFHMEMVVWHNAHWATWGRQKYFDNIFPELYETLLPSSLTRAKAMGWEGARWPKMTELNTGVSSPGGINGFLLWQQPHPMYLAELAYQASPTTATLERWDQILTATADYMASYAWKNETTGKYDLGPPAYGVTENTPPTESRNLAYEVAYWRYALDVARSWKQRLDQRVPEAWTTVASHLAQPPRADDGLYAVYDGLSSSWWSDPELAGDPRSLVMLQGILPDTAAAVVDPEVARRTADMVWEVWGDADIRGWGRPVLAINAARIGNAARAVYHLTAYDYWVFDDAALATVPASLAFECLRSVPNKPGPADQLVSSLKAYVEWQSTLAWLKAPPASYMLPPVDIQGNLDNISATAADGGYESEYDFQLAIYQTIISAHDGHFSYRPDIFKAFVFRNNLAADIVSVSTDGLELPKLYHRDALAADAQDPPVAITQINGQDAVKFLDQMSAKYSSFQDPDSQWNSQFPNYANPSALLSIAASLEYMGDNLTLTYENGEEKTGPSFAVVRDGADFDGIESGEDFYSKFCDPDNAEGTTAAATAASTSSSRAEERESVDEVVFPDPVVKDSGANETFGFFLTDPGYDDVAVLSVSSFAGEGVESVEYLTNFQEVVASFLDQSKQAGKKRLIVDLSANGGGFVVAGFELFAQIFPNISQFGADNMRLSDSLSDIANVIGGLPADFQPTTPNEAAALQALTQSSVLSNLIPGGVFTPAGEMFASVDDIVAPVALQGDEFTAYQNTPLNMPASDFNLTGTGSRADPPPAVFAPSDVVLLTDGTCGSTCTIFSYLMILEAGVRTVTAGGRPRPGPIQAIAGVEGAQVFYFSDLAQAAAAVQVLGPAAAADPPADPRQLGLLADGYAVRRAMDPASGGGSVNGKNAFGKADARTPFQFLYEPANCRFFYTADMLDRPEAAWRRAVDAAWTDPARFCVEGSRAAAPANATSQAVDPLFESSSQKSAADGGSSDGGASGAASEAGNSRNGAESSAVVATGGRGSQAVAIAALAAAATWLWTG